MIDSAEAGQGDLSVYICIFQCVYTPLFPGLLSCVHRQFPSQKIEHEFNRNGGVFGEIWEDTKAQLLVCSEAQGNRAIDL